VGDGEKDAQQFSVSELQGVVDHLDGFGMPGCFGGHLIIGGGLRGAA